MRYRAGVLRCAPVAHPGLHICLSLWTCAIARVFSAALRLPRYSATLRLPRSLPLISPFGLPSAGYPASPRWHVFAPAHLALRAAFGRLPSQPPLACVRSRLISLRFTLSGLPSAVVLRCASVAHPGLHICLSVDQCAIARVFSLRSIILPCRAPCGSLIRRFQLLTLAGLLTQSFSAIASIPERPPKPPGSREIWSFRFDS